MRAHVAGLDHVVILVHDLDRARDTYARMGFTLTPRGFHTLGSQNHCIMLGSDYLELLALPKTHPSMQHYADFLARGEGIGGIALATDDARGAHAGLAAAGVPVEAPIEFSRPVELPGGVREASFRVVQADPGFTAGARLFLCQHFARGVVWRDDCLSHPVGARGIAALAVVADDPSASVVNYAKVFDERPIPIDEGLLVQTGTAPIALATRGRIGHRLQGVALPLRPRPFVAALFIHVEDRARAADALRRGGFSPVALKDGSYAVGAGEAHGVAVVFG